MSVAAERVRAGGGPVVRTVATEASRRMPFAALGALVPADTTSFHPALAVGLVSRGPRTWEVTIPPWWWSTTPLRPAVDGDRSRRIPDVGG